MRDIFFNFLLFFFFFLLHSFVSSSGLEGLSAIEKELLALESELKELEVERLERIGLFSLSGKSTLFKDDEKDQYSLKNQLPDDYVQNYLSFIGGTKKKFTIKVDHKVKKIEFMQTKFGKNGSSPIGGGGGINDFSEQYILIVLTESNYILLLDSKGNLMHEYFTGHNIYKWALLQSSEEHSIYTLGEDYTVKCHSIRPIKKQDLEWINKSDSNSSLSVNSSIKLKQSSTQFKIKEEKTLNTTNKSGNTNKPKAKSLNLMIEYEGEFELARQTNLTKTVRIIVNDIDIDIEQQESIKDVYTAFEVYLQKQNRYAMIGDSTGHIHVYFKNGTKIGKSALSKHPIHSIHKHYPYPLYATKNLIGFFNQASLHTAFPQCDQTYEEITDLVIDGQHSQNIFVLQKNKEILIYDMKSQKNSCSVISRVMSGDIEEIEKFSQSNSYIQQLHNYIFFSSPNSPVSKALNITNFKQKNIDVGLDVGFYLSGLGSKQYSLEYSDEENSFQYSTFKHSSNHGFISYFEHLYSPANSSEITLITVHTPSPSWNFSENFKMPVIAVILAAFLFFSYCKKKKKTSFDETSMANIDNLIKDIQSGKKVVPNFKKDK